MQKIWFFCIKSWFLTRNTPKWGLFWNKVLVHQYKTNIHLSRLSLDWIERLALKWINNKINTGYHSNLPGKHPKNNNILQSYIIFYFLLKIWFIKTKWKGETSTSRGVFNDLVCQFRPHSVKPRATIGPWIPWYFLGSNPQWCQISTTTRPPCKIQKTRTILQKNPFVWII